MRFYNVFFLRVDFRARDSGPVTKVTYRIAGVIQTNMGIMSTGRAVKRLLICVIVLGLTIMAPGAVSLCALASSLATDCASSQTQSQCDQMDMATPSGPALTGQTSSCCTMSRAPLPESKDAPIIPSLQEEPVTISVLAVEVVHFENGRFENASHETSPPPLQPLLCTFLI